MERRISEVIEDAYKIAIPNVNKRVIPNFFDGMKPSQLRTVYSMINIASKKKVKVASIAGNCLAHYHPHGDQSIVDVVVDLVNKKILRGQGNFGQKYLFKDNDDAAAPRYIEAGLSKSFTELTTTLMKYCTFEESEVDGSKIPKHLLFPIPIAAITGSRGIGIAANTNIPAFTANSLLAAMKADDWRLLESTYSADIVGHESNIKKIWEQGHGKITYRMKVWQGEYAGAKGVFMSGNPYLFGKVDLSPFRQAMKEKLVAIYDVNPSTMFIARQFNVRKIDVDWIYRQCKKVRDVSDVYMISLNMDGVVGRSPLRYWIKTVYDNYTATYTTYIKDLISEKEGQILVLSHLKEIGKRLIANQSDSKIAKELKIPAWVVNEASKKSISMLRRDHKSAITKLEDEIKALESTDVVKSIDKLIAKL